MSLIPTERRTFIDPNIPFDQYTPEQQEEFKKYMRDKKAKEKVKKPIPLPRSMTTTKFVLPFFFDTDQSYLVGKTFVFELKGDVRNVDRIMIDEYAIRGFRYDDFLNDHYLLAEISGFANQVVSNTNLRAKYDYLQNKHVFFVTKDENINDSSLLSSSNHKYHQIYPNGRQINQTFIDLLKKLSFRFYRRNGSDMFTLHYKNLNPLDSYKLGTEPTFTFVSDLGNGSTNNTGIPFADNSLGDSIQTSVATITPGVYTGTGVCSVIADKMTRARNIRASTTIGNKKIDFTDGTGLHAASLDSAEYSYPFSGLTTDIAAKMNALGSQTYTVSFSETTGFITISAASSFTLHWLTQNVTTNAGQMLGYTRAADLTGTSLTSTVTLFYTVTFSLDTHKFTISNLTMPSFKLLTSLATYTAVNMLGYSTTDHTGAQTYTSDNTAPQEENPLTGTGNQMPFIRLMLWGHFEIDHAQDVNI